MFGGQYIGNILPRKDLNDGETTIPLSDPDVFNVVATYLKRWVSMTKPNVLKEHDRDGGTYGVVEEVFDDEEGLKAVFSLNSQTETELLEGRYRFVSPTIAWNFKANNNKIWPAALLEMSLVSVPRFFIGQASITKASGLSSLSESLSLESYLEHTDEGSNVILSNHTVNYAQKGDLNMDMEQLKTMLEEMLSEKMEAFRAEVMPKLEELEKLDAEARDDSKDVKEETSDDESQLEEPAPELEVLKAELEEARKQIALMQEELSASKTMMEDKEAKDAVESIMSQKPHLSSMKEKLVSVYKRDRDLFNDIVGLDFKPSVLSQRISQGTPIALEVKDPYEYALELQAKEGLTYKAALERALNK